ncbi:MAG: hypothetical protein Q9164_005434 [Protoblastenia rupestris]
MSHPSRDMADQNQDYANLCSSRSAKPYGRPDLSRVEHQTSHRPMQLRNHEESSRSRSKATVEKDNNKAGSEFDLMWKYIDEFLLLGKSKSSKPAGNDDRSRPQMRPSYNTASRPDPSRQTSHRSPSRQTGKSREPRQRQAKVDGRNEDEQRYTFWGELKSLIKSTFNTSSERKAALATQHECQAREAAKARAEKAATPTPIYDSMRSRFSVRQSQRRSPNSVSKPQPAVTRTKLEATPGTYPFIDRKPVPTYQKELKSVPKHAVKVTELPRTHDSVHLVRQMPSNASKSRPEGFKSSAIDKKQGRATRLGDFMVDSAPSPPSKDNPNFLASSSKPAQRSLDPLQCNVCGAEPGPGFAFSKTNLWLCPSCLDPPSPFEAPPTPKEDRNSRSQRAQSSFERSTVGQSTLSRSCSPLSAISRSRRLSEDEAFDISDGEISPISDWHRNSNDIHPALRQPPTPAHRPTVTPQTRENTSAWGNTSIPTIDPSKVHFDPTYNPLPLPPKQKGKQRQPSHSPIPGANLPSPLRTNKARRAASSIYPEDEPPAIPDVPLPPIPAIFRTAPHEEPRKSFYPSTPGNSPPRLTKARYVDGEQGRLGILGILDSEALHRRSSFYGFYAPILREHER